MSDARRLSTVMAEPFYPVHAAIRAHDYTHFWLRGGRGSTKSSFASLEVISLLLRNPGVNAIAIDELVVGKNAPPLYPPPHPCRSILVPA